MTNKYHIGSICFDILCFNDFDYSLLSGFETSDESQYTISIDQNDIELEINKSGLRFSDEMLCEYEFLSLQRKITNILMFHNVLLLHGSCISINNKAYLFIANSGTGKSTHTRLWRELLPEAIMVNDDKPFVKITDDGAIAYGSPWNGKHHLGNNISVPLAGICLLSRDSTNHIEPLEEKDILPTLLKYTYRPQTAEGTNIMLSNVIKLSKLVDFYKLGCNMDISAAKLSYETMVLGKQ